MNKYEGGQAPTEAEAIPTTKKRIAILNRRHIDVLNYIAQGYTNEVTAKKLNLSFSTIRQNVNQISELFNTTTSFQAVQKAIDLNFIDQEILVKNFDSKKFRLLSPSEHEILKTMIKNGGEKSIREDIANSLNRSEGNVKENLLHIYDKLGESNGIKVAAIYKIYRNKKYKDESALYLADLDDNYLNVAFTESDLHLLTKINEKKRLINIAKKVPSKQSLAVQVDHIRQKIGTLPRLEALQKGLSKGAILLPPRSEEKKVNVDALLNNHLTKQLMIGLSKPTFEDLDPSA